MDNLKFVNALITATKRRRIKWAEPEKLLDWIAYKARNHTDEVYFVNLDGYLLVAQAESTKGDSPILTLLDWNMEEIYTFDQDTLLERDDGFLYSLDELEPGSEDALCQLFALVQDNVRDMADAPSNIR